MAKERMVPKVIEKWRDIRGMPSCLICSWNWPHAYYENGRLHQRLLETMAGVSWWRNWWNTSKQNLCNVEVVLDAVSQPAPGVQADECKSRLTRRS